MSAKIGVITFPGTRDDVDAARAARLAGADAVPLWHADADLKGVGTNSLMIMKLEPVDEAVKLLVQAGLY